MSNTRFYFILEQRCNTSSFNSSFKLINPILDGGHSLGVARCMLVSPLLARHTSFYHQEDCMTFVNRCYRWLNKFIIRSSLVIVSSSCVRLHRPLKSYPIRIFLSNINFLRHYQTVVDGSQTSLLILKGDSIHTRYIYIVHTHTTLYTYNIHTHVIYI